MTARANNKANLPSYPPRDGELSRTALSYWNKCEFNHTESVECVLGYAYKKSVQVTEKLYRAAPH
jgi:hypothetical protein